jgi:hypothetical protein
MSRRKITIKVKIIVVQLVVLVDTTAADSIVNHK